MYYANGSKETQHMLNYYRVQLYKNLQKHEIKDDITYSAVHTMLHMVSCGTSNWCPHCIFDASVRDCYHTDIIRRIDHYGMIAYKVNSKCSVLSYQTLPYDSKAEFCIDATNKAMVKIHKNCSSLALMVMLVVLILELSLEAIRRKVLSSRLFRKESP